MSYLRGIPFLKKLFGQGGKSGTGRFLDPNGRGDKGGLLQHRRESVVLDWVVYLVLLPAAEVKWMRRVMTVAILV